MISRLILSLLFYSPNLYLCSFLQCSSYSSEPINGSELICARGRCVWLTRSCNRSPVIMHSMKMLPSIESIFILAKCSVHANNAHFVLSQCYEYSMPTILSCLSFPVSSWSLSRPSHYIILSVSSHPFFFFMYLCVCVCSVCHQECLSKRILVSDKTTKDSFWLSIILWSLHECY